MSATRLLRWSLTVKNKDKAAALLRQTGRNMHTQNSQTCYYCMLSELLIQVWSAVSWMDLLINPLLYRYPLLGQKDHIASCAFCCFVPSLLMDERSRRTEILLSSPGWNEGGQTCYFRIDTDTDTSLPSARSSHVFRIRMYRQEAFHIWGICLGIHM